MVKARSRRTIVFSRGRRQLFLSVSSAFSMPEFVKGIAALSRFLSEGLKREAPLRFGVPASAGQAAVSLKDLQIF